MQTRILLLHFEHGNQATVMTIAYQRRPWHLRKLQLPITKPIVQALHDPLPALRRRGLRCQRVQICHFVERGSCPPSTLQIHQQFDANWIWQHKLVGIQCSCNEIRAQTTSICIFFLLAALVLPPWHYRLQAQPQQFCAQSRSWQFFAQLGFGNSLHRCDFHGALHSRPCQGLVVLQATLALIESVLPKFRSRNLRECTWRAEQNASPLLAPFLPLFALHVLAGPHNDGKKGFKPNLWKNDNKTNYREGGYIFSKKK